MAKRAVKPATSLMVVLCLLAAAVAGVMWYRKDSAGWGAEVDIESYREGGPNSIFVVVVITEDERVVSTEVVETSERVTVLVRARRSDPDKLSNQLPASAEVEITLKSSLLGRDVYDKKTGKPVRASA